MDIIECSLADLMEDPLVGLVMKSDGVDRCELELLFERVGRRGKGTDGQQHSRGLRLAMPGLEAAPCSPC